MPRDEFTGHNIANLGIAVHGDRYAFVPLYNSKLIEPKELPADSTVDSNPT
jgi:hypothetical protein